jgi:AraC-like DNA-binding protein
MSSRMRSGRTAIAHTRLGRDRLAPGTTMQRHRHAIGYVAVVLAGGYLESGDAGRRQVGPGDALVHRPFEGHLDRIGARGAVVVNVPAPVSIALPDAFRVVDADAIARAAESDVTAASELLEPSTGVVALEDDWPDRLAALLRVRSDVRLAQWADAMRLAPETVSRGFRAAFGATPARYRAEARARRALAALCERDDPLVEIALACGFADQSHMSRAIVELTGVAPSAWRRRAPH